MAIIDQDPGLSRTRVTPIPAPRTVRMQDVRGLTSLPAGRMVPLHVFPMLREDAIRRCSLRMSFEMMETNEILMNGVIVRCMAYLVSNLAMDRFDGMDALNRSYRKVAVEGLPVVPFIHTTPLSMLTPINKYLGLHFKEMASLNADYMEAYNQIWNFRARNRSKDLVPRGLMTGSLAPAFWRHKPFQNVVPDFDQAVIDGEVPLNVTEGALPIRGLGWEATVTTQTAGNTIRTVGGGTEVTSATVGQRWSASGSTTRETTKEDPANPGWPGVWAEMQENGITVSLSNIELARKTQAFARLKEQYQGMTDEYIIDLLMEGIRVPEQALNQPILLADKSTVFGMSKRYSTDADAMTESVVNGATFIDMTFRVPQLNTGGVVMVVCEILPEQLFERQSDPYLHVTDVEQLPEYLRDSLDPEKVEVVTNGQVDAAHATPNGTFGYAPLNWKWMQQQPRIGGKFHRSNPADSTNDEVRQRIWAVESTNPTYAADFLVSTAIHTKPFVVQNQDPFEVVTRGLCVYDGLTVFGGALVESTGSYEEIMGEAPLDRIDQASALEGEVLPPAATKPGPKPEPKKPDPARAKSGSSK